MELSLFDERDFLRRNWHILVPGMKARWERLSEEDYLQIAGDWDELAAHLMLNYQSTALQAENEIRRFLGMKQDGDQT